EPCKEKEESRFKIPPYWTDPAKVNPHTKFGGWVETAFDTKTVSPADWWANFRDFSATKDSMFVAGLKLEVKYGTSKYEIHGGVGINPLSNVYPGGPIIGHGKWAIGIGGIIQF